MTSHRGKSILRAVIVSSVLHERVTGQLELTSAELRLTPLTRVDDPNAAGASWDIPLDDICELAIELAADYADVTVVSSKQVFTPAGRRHTSRTDLTTLGYFFFDAVPTQHERPPGYCLTVRLGSEARQFASEVGAAIVGLRTDGFVATLAAFEDSANTALNWGGDQIAKAPREEVRATIRISGRANDDQSDQVLVTNRRLLALYGHRSVHGLRATQREIPLEEVRGIRWHDQRVHSFDILTRGSIVARPTQMVAKIKASRDGTITLTHFRNPDTGREVASYRQAAQVTGEVARRTKSFMALPRNDMQRVRSELGRALLDALDPKTDGQAATSVAKAREQSLPVELASDEPVCWHQNWGGTALWITSKRAILERGNNSLWEIWLRYPIRFVARRGLLSSHLTIVDPDGVPLQAGYAGGAKHKEAVATFAVRGDARALADAINEVVSAVAGPDQ